MLTSTVVDCGDADDVIGSALTLRQQHDRHFGGRGVEYECSEGYRTADERQNELVFKCQWDGSWAPEQDTTCERKSLMIQMK